MRNFYPSIAAVALTALMSANAFAQLNSTVRSATHQASYALKKHSNGIAAPVDPSRGGNANDECAVAIPMTVGATCVPVAGNATVQGSP